MNLLGSSKEYLNLTGSNLLGPNLKYSYKVGLNLICLNFFKIPFRANFLDLSLKPFFLFGLGLPSLKNLK